LHDSRQSITLKRLIAKYIGREEECNVCLSATFHILFIGLVISINNLILGEFNYFLQPFPQLVKPEIDFLV